MKKKSESQPIPKTDRNVFYTLDQGSGLSVHRGVIVHQTGPFVAIERQGADASRSVIESVPSTSVLNADELALVAHDMLPHIDPGEEMTLQQGVERLVDEQQNNPEFAGRVAAAALANYVTKDRTHEELGVRSVDEIVGDESIRGTNAWKIRELITGYKNNQYHAGSSNYLELGRPSPDLSLVSQSEAEAVTAQLDTNNRAALDTLYEVYGVDFAESHVYESTRREGTVVRKTVYPAPTNGISFVETSITGSSATKHPSGINSLDVTIEVGIPIYTNEKGYYLSP